MTSPSPKAEVTQADPELLPCWTCRGRTFVEISHSSQEYGWPLYRCVSCKAIYPERALSSPPDPQPVPPNTVVALANKYEGINPNAMAEISVSDLRAAAMAISHIAIAEMRARAICLQPEGVDETFLALRLFNAVHKDATGFKEAMSASDLSDRQMARCVAGVRAILASAPSALAGGVVREALAQIESRIVEEDGYVPISAFDAGTYKGFTESARILHAALAQTETAQPREDVDTLAVKYLTCLSTHSGGPWVTLADARAAIAAALSPPQPSEAVTVETLCAFEAGQEDGWEKAREEAARTADGYANFARQQISRQPAEWTTAAETAEIVAANIRALKSTPRKGGGQMRYANDKTPFWRRVWCHLAHGKYHWSVPVHHSWDVICTKCGYNYLSID